MIAAVLIIVGLYGVLWGKGKEMKQKQSAQVEVDGSKSSGEPELRGIVIETSSTSEGKLPASNTIYPIQAADRESSAVPSVARGE